MTARNCFLCATSALSVLLADPADAGPSMAAHWAETTLDTADCVARAEATMREAGMTQNVEKFRESVFGEQGDYTALVRCPTGKGVVFFVVSGPRPDRASKLMNDIKGRF
jgi:hypothetical protein